MMSYDALGCLINGEEAGMPERQLRLADVMARYGEDWSISRSDGPDVWTAVCRPKPTALHVLVAYSLPELSEKLAKANGDQSQER
jgi:hypothetical protein